VHSQKTLHVSNKIIHYQAKYRLILQVKMQIILLHYDFFNFLFFALSHIATLVLQCDLGLKKKDHNVLHLYLQLKSVSSLMIHV
jgi:hypothetical protein